MVNCLAELLELQQTDLRLRDLESRLKLLPQEMKKMLADREKLLSEVKQAADAVRRQELQLQQLESKIAGLQEENRKLQQQSALVKKNTEYQAMLGQIEHNRQEISDLEDRQLLMFDEIEEAKNAAAQLKRKNNDEIKLIKTEFDEMIDFSKQVEAEIARLKAVRPNQAKKVPAEILSSYERLLGGKKQQMPVCEVVNGICGGCHLRVTPQAMNDMAQGQLAVCDNCQCFIYVGTRD